MNVSFYKYFKKAEEKGIDPFQISFSETTEMTVSTLDGKVESQEIGTSHSIAAKGLFQGRKAACSTDVIDDKTADYLTDSICKNAKYGEKSKREYFCPGGLKYKKVKYAEGDFVDSDLKEIRETCLQMYPKVKRLDERIEKIEINLQKMTDKYKKENSLGLRLSRKTVSYSLAVVVSAFDKDTGDKQTGFACAISYESLKDIVAKSEKIFSKAVKSAVDLLNAKSCSSRICKAILSPKCFADFLSAFAGQFNQKAVNKKISLYCGKLKKQIVSPVLTIYNKPHMVSPAACSFDGDGYPTQDFCWIEKGKLKEYFRSIESALQKKQKSNGCGSGGGNASYRLLWVEPGNVSLSQLLAEMRDGIYITDISGLNSGLDYDTLDFSLPCSGYMVEKGKIVSSVSMITLSGNLKNVLENVQMLSNEKGFFNDIYLPSCLFFGAIISGN